jgi:hypothetical protein
MYQCSVGWHVVVKKGGMARRCAGSGCGGGRGGGWPARGGVWGGVDGRGRCCGTGRERGPIVVVLWWYFVI